MIGSFNTEIIRDFGINLSATQLSKRKIIYKKAHGKIKNTNIKVRVFHNSRVTNHEIYKKKKEFTKKAYKNILMKNMQRIKKLLSISQNSFTKCIVFLLEFL